jgi:hypothetical protein
MFEQAVQASLAMQRAAQQDRRTLIPALSGCPSCQTMLMIAAPVLGRCEHCGDELKVLSSAAYQDDASEAPGARAA